MKKLFLFVIAIALVACNGNKVPELTGISLNKKAIELEVGDSYKLKVRYQPEEAAETAPEILWESANTKIAKVDDNGKVTAKAIGKTTITATCGKFEAECEVEVVAASDPDPDPDPDPETEIVDGALMKAVFPIDNTGKKVRFSQGNLQFQLNTGKFYFAENQLKTLGKENEQITADYVGRIDLFGWGTGGFPTQASTKDEDYPTFVDWGTNPIENGGNKANKWRTLSAIDWNYLLELGCKKYGVSEIDGKLGILILPPTFVAPEGVDMKVWAFSADDWKKLEPEGCVFLPDAGIRAGLEYNGFSPTRVCCWTTTPYTDSYGYALTADGDALIEITMAARHFGMSVRLVEDVE